MSRAGPIALVALVALACSEDEAGRHRRPVAEPAAGPVVDADPSAVGAIHGRIDDPRVGPRRAVVAAGTADGRTFEPGRSATLDQKGMRFVPHVQAVLVGTTVRLTNSDAFRHNVWTRSGPIDLDLQFVAGQSHEVVLDRPGVVAIGCRFHSSMEAYLVVVETPWFATTGDDGSFEIEGVPSGRQRLTIWHPDLGTLVRTVEVEPGGRVEIVVGAEDR